MQIAENELRSAGKRERSRRRGSVRRFNPLEYHGIYSAVFRKQQLEETARIWARFVQAF